MGWFPFNHKSYSSVSLYKDVEDDKTSEMLTSYEDEKNRLQPTLTATEGTLLKSISHHDNRNHKFYKPTSNRTWVLSVFLVALGLCIAALEWSLFTHSDARLVMSLEDGTGTATASRMVRRGFLLFERQATTSPEASDITHVFTFPTQSPSPTSAIVSTASVTKLPVTDNVTGQPLRGSELAITSSQTSNTVVTPGQPFEASQLSVTESVITVGQPFVPAQLSITAPDQLGPPQPTITTFPVTRPQSPPPNSQLSLTQNNDLAQVTSAQALSISSVASNGISTNNLAGPSGSGSRSGAASDQQKTGGAGFASPSPSLQGASPILSSSLVILTNSAGIPTATHEIVMTTAIVYTNSEGNPTATRPGSLLPHTTTTGDSHLANDKHSIVTEGEYFVAMYMPSIIGVVMQSAWLVTFATFKLMQPFYQLAGHDGATAKSTLTADYLATGLTVSFSRAFLDGHWVMILAGLVQLCLAIIVTFASEAMKIVPTALCKTEVSDAQPCNPQWVVHLVMIRALEVALVACFSMTLAIIVLNRKRVSGVYADPSRIATMADVLVHKPLINELRDLPALASKSQIAHDLQDSRYMLGTFVDENNRQHYGIIKLDQEAVTRCFKREASYKSAYRRFANSTEALSNDLHKVAPYAADGFCMGLVVILFGIILGYYLTPGDSTNPFNSWMNSKELGPSLFLTCMGVLIGFLVKRKERFFRLSHPYVLMAKGPQPASETITAGTRATQFSAFISGIMRGNVSLSLLSLAAVFSDIILVLIPGIPFSGAQTRPVYLASTFTVLGLLGFILVVQIRITFKEWQRGHIECPETVASALMRLCASRFVEEKNIHEHWSKELDIDRSEEFGLDDEAKQHLRYDGPDGERRYRFGCMEGVDGVQRWMVEEDIWQRRA